MVFGFLFVIGVVIAIWFLRSAGSAAQSVTKVVLDKATDSLGSTFELADECKRAGLKMAPVKPGSMLKHWVNEAGEVYGTNEAAVARLRREAR